MSPKLALASPIFLFYVSFIGAGLAFTGLILAILSWAYKKNLQSVWTIYRGWLVIVPLILGSIFAGREVTIIVFSLVALAGFKEFARATGLYRDWWMTGSVYMAIVAFCLIALMKDPHNGRAGWFGMFRTLPVFAIAFILLIPIVRNRAKGQLQAFSLAVVGFIYIVWMFGHLAFLANSHNPYGYLLFLIVAVELNDVAAFTFGKLLGCHKLRSEISPNKTWEGALGALAMSLIMPWLLGFSFPHFALLQKVLTGLIVGIGGQLGDLSISVIKRDLGIKDMGVVVSGHGGVLDRIDSLIYTAPLFFHMVNWFHGLYGVRG